MNNNLPFHAEGRDELRLGLGSVKDDKVPSHPVEMIQDQYDVAQHQNKKMMLAQVYGVHLPMKMDMEEKALAQFRRAPGLRSSMVGLETILGLDTDMDFCDYLNNPDFSPYEVDVHTALEARQDGMALAKRK